MLSITTAFFAMRACLMPSPQVFGGSWTETKLKAHREDAFAIARLQRKSKNRARVCVISDLA